MSYFYTVTDRFNATVLFFLSLAVERACAVVKRGSVSSVGRALDYREGGEGACRGFDSRDQTNTQGFKITEK